MSEIDVDKKLGGFKDDYAVRPVAGGWSIGTDGTAGLRARLGKKSINIYAELSLGISYGQPDLSAVTVTEYDPVTGVTTKRTFIPNGFIWIDGVKVDVLHVTEVVTDLTGKVVERTTYSLEVTDAAEALGLLRDYAESQLDAPGAEGAEDRM